MLPNLGPMELIIILGIALIVFGPKKLPEFGKSVGKALREFNKAKNDFMSSINTDDDDDDRPRRSIPDDTVAASESHALDYPAPPDLDSADALPFGSDFHAASSDTDSQTALHSAHSVSDVSGTPAAAASGDMKG
jgi:sec-independent protein translocase protein TatA